MIGLIPTFLQSHETIAHSKHYITPSEIEQWFKNASNPGTSMKKFGIELKKHLSLLGINPETEVKSKVKKMVSHKQFGLA